MINQSLYWLKSIFTQSEFLIKDEVALGVYEELRLVYPELGVIKQALIRSTGIENYMKILKETTTRGARDHVQNSAHPDGVIAEQYLHETTRPWLETEHAAHPQGNAAR